MLTKLQACALRRLTAHVRKKTNGVKGVRVRHHYSITSLGQVTLALNGNFALIAPNFTGCDEGEIAVNIRTKETTTDKYTIEGWKYTLELIERYVNTRPGVRLSVSSEQLKGKKVNDLYTVGIQDGISFGVPVGVLRDASRLGIALYTGYNGYSMGIFGKSPQGLMLVMGCNKY